MSLIADVTVNNVLNVGQVVITRIEGDTGEDTVNTYEYTITEVDRHTHVSEVVASGKVYHRYGDGGMRLLLMVLLDAQPHL